MSIKPTFGILSPELRNSTLLGDIYGHPLFLDGSPTSIGPVIETWIDGETKYFETEEAIYKTFKKPTAQTSANEENV